METRIYAPIVIPTLNRFEHFRCCLESLERCTGADQTDVFVGLDYPPSEKYVEGWKKIDAYLLEKEKKNGFRNLYVTRRNHNCGVKGLNSNYCLLLNEVKTISDRFISTEDDNEFSPNFLMYMNWALNEYKDDESIYAICGFKRIDTRGLRNNVYKYPRFNAWGFGQWFKTREKLDKYRNLSYLKGILDKMSIWSVFTSDVYKGCSIISMLKEGVVYGDALPKFLPKDEQFCLFPKLSMVRNHGHDGLGLHGGTEGLRKMYESLQIDESDQFEPYIVEDLYLPILDKVYKTTYRLSLSYRIRFIFDFILYKTTRLGVYHRYGQPKYKIQIKKVIL